MRIALDYQTFTLQTYGGISRYFTRLAQELLFSGEQVKIFAPLHRNAFLASLPSNSISGRRLNWYPPKTTSLFLFYNYLMSRRAVEQWKPNIVHETYYARQRSSSKKYPTVITVYDMIHELFRQEFSSRDKTAEFKKKAIARADHVICISENTKKDLIYLYGMPERKISVVPLGFDQFTKQAQASENNPKSGKPFLLYVGARGGYKNFAAFIECLAASRALRSDFDVLAFGGGKFTSAELSLISSHGFSLNQVRQISGDDTLLGSCYAAARAFVYPSLYEGFGIPPLEAMAQNCPVVASNTSSMPEVIGQAGEYFNPANIGEMKRAIESVVYSDRRVANLKARGAERLAHFSWAKCAEQTRAVYRTLL